VKFCINIERTDLKQQHNFTKLVTVRNTLTSASARQAQWAPEVLHQYWERTKDCKQQLYTFTKFGTLHDTPQQNCVLWITKRTVSILWEQCQQNTLHKMFELKNKSTAVVNAKTVLKVWRHRTLFHPSQSNSSTNSPQKLCTELSIALTNSPQTFTLIIEVYNRYITLRCVL
jgi:hypothetical protein